jgi:ribosomal protein L11 methyltransferase
VNGGTLHEVAFRVAPAAEEPVAALCETVFGGAAVFRTDLRAGRTTAVVFSEEPIGRLRARCHALRAGLAALRAEGVDCGTGPVRLRRIRREDWARSWKRHFRPLEFGDLLLVKPGWSRRRPKRGQVVVTLDPGMSFGTGQHATTAYCLRELVRAVRERRPRRGRKAAGTGAARSVAPLSCLDIGTGSGILALAAAKLGCARVDAFDFDRDAVRIARANARRNRVADRLTIWRADLTRLPRRPAWRYDLVFANLTHDLLCAEAGRISNRIARGGRLVVAGILRPQFVAVERAFARRGLRRLRSTTEKEWRSGVFIWG